MVHTAWNRIDPAVGNPMLEAAEIIHCD
jgi:hypothetical protein